MSTTQPAGAPVLRHALVPFRGLEWRDAGETGDGSYTFTGHAAVYDQETVLYDLGWYRLREKIVRGAFRDVLARKPDVVFNALTHDQKHAIARTGIRGIGGLELSEDEIGLRVFARLDPEDPDVIALERKMRRGIVDQMSFAFTIEEQERSIEEDADGNTDVLRTVHVVRDLYDVTALAQGAYPQTDAALRSLLTVLGRAGIDPAGLNEHRAGGRPAGADPVAPEQPAGGEQQRDHRLDAMRMHVRVAETYLT